MVSEGSELEHLAVQACLRNSRPSDVVLMRPSSGDIPQKLSSRSGVLHALFDPIISSSLKSL